MSLTPEQIEAAAPKFVEELIKAAGGPERTEADFRVIGSQPYKPFYRSCALLLADNHTYHAARERMWGDGNAYPTVDQAMELLTMAHPWFADALARDPEEFKTHFGMTVFGSDLESENLIDPSYVR